MDKYSNLNPTLTTLCRNGESNMYKHLQMEYGRLMAMSVTELEAEMKRSFNFERRQFIHNIIERKRACKII